MVGCYTLADNPVRGNPPGDAPPEVEVAALDVFPSHTILDQLPPEFRDRWASGVPLAP
jgi:hypothetical protein